MLSGPSNIYFRKNYNLWAWHIVQSQLLLCMYLNAKDFKYWVNVNQGRLYMLPFLPLRHVTTTSVLEMYHASSILRCLSGNEPVATWKKTVEMCSENPTPLSSWWHSRSPIGLQTGCFLDQFSFHVLFFFKVIEAEGWKSKQKGGIKQPLFS